ncbi:hypothetical protein VHN57_02480 [Sphingobium sp. WW5]|jgi:hypothetical protein|uniref:hypothetical protein n=1 Tax=Sphingobium TaxID=165695 RepID=UPI0010CA6A1D|nr:MULTISPECIES: hypothetical protein [Sphingobium]TKV43177.1 hypothetical protein A0U87_01960 [Sphingobium sp. MP9-4]
MAKLNKEAIFAAAKPKVREVEVEEWGVRLNVRAHTLRSRMALLDADTINADAVEEYERDQALPDDERTGVEKVERFDAAIINFIHSIVDDNGDQLFDLSDHDRFRDLSYATLVAIHMAIQQVNEVKPVSFTDLKKNSD